MIEQWLMVVSGDDNNSRDNNNNNGSVMSVGSLPALTMQMRVAIYTAWRNGIAAGTRREKPWRAIKSLGRGALVRLSAAGRGTWAVLARTHVRERDDLHGTRI